MGLQGVRGGPPRPQCRSVSVPSAPQPRVGSAALTADLQLPEPPLHRSHRSPHAGRQGGSTLCSEGRPGTAPPTDAGCPRPRLLAAPARPPGLLPNFPAGGGRCLTVLLCPVLPGLQKRRGPHVVLLRPRQRRPLAESWGERPPCSGLVVHSLTHLREPGASSLQTRAAEGDRLPGQTGCGRMRRELRCRALSGPPCSERGLRGAGARKEPAEGLGGCRTREGRLGGTSSASRATRPGPAVALELADIWQMMEGRCFNFQDTHAPLWGPRGAPGSL